MVQALINCQRCKATCIQHYYSGRKERGGGFEFKFTATVEHHNSSLNLNVKKKGFVTIFCFLLAACGNSVLNTLLCQGGVGFLVVGVECNLEWSAMIFPFWGPVYKYMCQCGLAKVLSLIMRCSFGGGQIEGTTQEDRYYF